VLTSVIFNVLPWLPGCSQETLKPFVGGALILSYWTPCLLLIKSYRISGGPQTKVWSI